MKQNSQNLVIFAKDVSRLSLFYQQVLGLMISESAKSHELLQGPGIEVVIHAIPKAVANKLKIQAPPEQRDYAAIKPAFFVDDLHATRLAVESNGGVLKPIKSAWKIRGAMVLDGCDCEGNVIQFKCHNTPHE